MDSETKRNSFDITQKWDLINEGGHNGCTSFVNDYVVVVVVAVVPGQSGLVKTVD